LEDSENGLWIALRNGTLDYGPVGDKTHRFNHLAGNGTTIRQIFEDQSGVIWLMTSKGICYAPIRDAKKNNWKFISAEQGLTHEKCYNILQEKPHVYWVATYGGLNRMEFDSLENAAPAITKFESDNSNSRSHINSMSYSVKKDELGRIWIGTFYGIS